VLAFALVVSARPQDYDDYDQPAQRQQQKQQYQKRAEERETSTFIPIIQYDKEQEINGNYKTQ
jgi:hypothetical protein